MLCTVLWGLCLPPVITKNLYYPTTSSSHMRSRIKDVKSQGNADILFIGSSHAYRSFDTRIFEANGINTFNLGSSAQSPIQTNILVNRYLALLKPKLVVFEVYPLTFFGDGVESALDLIANDKIDMATIKMALKLNNMRVYITLLYGLFRNIFSLDRHIEEDIHIGTDTYIKGGFVEKDSKVYSEDDHPWPSKTWEFNQSQMDVFENIVTRVKESNIDIVLVQAPFISQRYNSYSNNAEVDNYFKSLGSYYNFNKIINFPSHEYFFDSHHMNQKGVAIFNNELIKILKNEKTLKNRIF